MKEGLCMPKMVEKVGRAATLLFALSLTAAAAGEANHIAGKWKLGAFYTEDLLSKERHNVYGPAPIGTMRLLSDGTFNAEIRTKQREVSLSLWEDVAYSLIAEVAPAI